MANDITFVGNLGGDPNLRYLPKGTAVATINVGDTPRRMDKATNQYIDGETLWQTVEVWDKLAENVAASLKKGDRVIVIGRLVAEKFNDKTTGEPRTVTKLKATFIGPDLSYATAAVTRNPRGGNGGNGGGYQQQAPAQQAPVADQGWSASNDETPF